MSGTTIDKKYPVKSTVSQTDIDNGIASHNIDPTSHNDIRELIDDKANSTDVYLKTETYSQTEVDTLIDGVSIDAYTKTESDTLLAGKMDDGDAYLKTETYSQTEVDALISGVGGYTDPGLTVFEYKDDLLRVSGAPFALDSNAAFASFASGGSFSVNTNKVNFFSSTQIINGFHGLSYASVQSANTNESVSLGYRTVKTSTSNQNTLLLDNIKSIEIEMRTLLLPATGTGYDNKRGEVRFGLGVGGISGGGYLYTSAASTPSTAAYFVRYKQSTGELGIHTRGSGAETFTVLKTLTDSEAKTLNYLKFKIENISGTITISLYLNGVLLGQNNTNIVSNIGLDYSIMYTLNNTGVSGNAGFAIDSIRDKQVYNI